MAENNRKWFISGKPNENDYMDWWNAYNSMDDSTSLEDANTMTDEWNKGSWNNGKDAATFYKNNGISFSQFAESPAGKFLLSRPRARGGIKESYGLSDKVGELLDKGDIKAAMELAKQEEQNTKPSVVNDGDVTIPEADAPSEPETEEKTAPEAENETDNKEAATEKKNYFAELGKVIAKGAELGKAKSAELGKAIAKGAKKITNSDIYKDYVYGNIVGSTKYSRFAKDLKEENAANFLANEYPSLLTAVFSRKSGNNLGQRLAGLGELLATLGGAAANGALAGFHGQTAPAPVVGRQAQMYNNAYMKQNERAQNRFDAANKAEIEYADKYARVNRTKYLKDAPEEIKDFAITSLGSAPLDYEGFKGANMETFKIFVNRQIAKYNRVKLIPFQELDKDEQKRLMGIFENIADKEMLPYYNEYRFVHDQYDEGLRKQGLVLSNTGTSLSNTGTELSNVYKSLENQSKNLSNKQQKQTFINSIRDQINNLRKLKYESIKSQSLDYFAVEKALMDVVTGIYTTSTGSSFSGSAGVNIKAINAGVSGNKSAGSQIDSLAKKNIPLAKEAADAFKKLTDGNINEWNKWIDAQIKELEKTLDDVNKSSPEDYQSRLGYDGNSRINKDFDYYRQILMG